MKRLKALVLGLVVTALGAGAASAQLSGRPALDFSERGAATSDGAQSAFARSVTARYAASFTRAQVFADLQAQGFTCDASAGSCTHVAMTDSCAEVRSVDITPDGTIRGGHTVRCMGALADDE